VGWTVAGRSGLLEAVRGGARRLRAIVGVARSARILWLGRSRALVGELRDLLTINTSRETLLLSINMAPTSEVPYGTLDLMVLKTLAALSPLHGYGIARRIEQVAQGSLALNQGTIYPALLRLEQKGWIKSDWGMSENNRRARFYSITAAGKRQLAAEADLWSQTVATVNRLLEES
jgi:PadR family transcriptional regulator PadR